MNTNTSASAKTANVKVYKNLLEAHTAFVLDRYAFMENIQTAINQEDKPESLALFVQLKEGNFIELIAGLLSDPDTHNREQAFYTLANVLGLENQDVIVQRAKAALLERHQDIFHNLYAQDETPLLQKTCAYVINNLAMVFANRGWKDLDKDEDGTVRKFCNQVLDAFNGLYGDALVNRVVSKTARTDLLYAAARVSQARPFGPRLSRVLADMLGATGGGAKSLLDMLNSRLAEAETPEQFIPTDYHGEVLDRFLLFLSNDKLSRQTRMEALWGLSNFATETDVADKLAAYDELIETVVDIAITEGGNTRENAIWVLANVVAKATSAETQEALSHHSGIWNALAYAVRDWEERGLTDYAPLTVATETIAKLTAWEVQFEEDEEDDDETILDEIEADMQVEEDGKTILYEMKTSASVPVEERVPTALDLILEGSPKPSAVVRRLICSLQEAGYGQWVVVPADTQLTVADLTTLQAMGYSLNRGYFSVSRALMDVIYA
jgi:hypothetical protein